MPSAITLPKSDTCYKSPCNKASCCSAWRSCNQFVTSFGTYWGIIGIKHRVSSPLDECLDCQPHMASATPSREHRPVLLNLEDEPPLTGVGHARIWPKPHLARISVLSVLAKIGCVCVCCVCCVCCVFFGVCVQDCWWVSSRFSLPRTAPPQHRPSAGPPKISLFFFSRRKFHSFFSLSLSGWSSR